MKKIILLFLLPFFLNAQWLPAKITFSDGSTQTGKVAPMNSRPLQIAENRLRSVHQKLMLKDVISITQTVENSAMNKPWMYKENGKNEKVFFDGEYPFIEFRTVILLTNGKTISGHIIAYPLRFKGEGTKKIFLNRQYKGREGEKMADVKYVEKIEFPENKPQQAVELLGTVSDYGKLISVSALDSERGIVYSAKCKGGSFSFAPLLQGKYDLYILTDTHVLAGFKGVDTIPPELEKNFSKADDFFPSRRIVLLNGTRCFVYKSRSEVYDAEKHLKGGFLWHLEQWNWHQAGSEWKLDTRNILIRRKQKGGELVRHLMIVNDLNAVSGGKIVIDKNTPVIKTGKLDRP